MLLQIPAVLESRELASLRMELRDTTFEDGAASAGFIARNVKRNLQVPQKSDAGRTCAATVVEALRRSSVFFSAALPHRMHGPIFNRYDTGMAYGPHVDNALMGTSTVRTDVAVTLFLSAPDEYEGGELTIHDAFGVHRVKLPAGSVIVYPASSRHHVEPVTKGCRLAAVLWIQSLVRDETRRRLLFELDLNLAELRKRIPDAPELENITATYHNLLRQWAEP